MSLTTISGIIKMKNYLLLLFALLIVGCGTYQPEQAIERVATRVSEGGHNIPSDVIRRRYANGLRNLTMLYTPVCDFWTIYDNSSADAEIKIIASGEKDATIQIEDTLSYKIITDHERD